MWGGNTQVSLARRVVARFRSRLVSVRVGILIMRQRERCQAIRICTRGLVFLNMWLMTDPFLGAAIEEARKGLAEGGIPIGSVLVIDGRIVGRGHNRRVQKGSAILHAEMDCLENAGRLRPRRLPPRHALLNALAVRHVQRHRPALPHPANRHRREPHVSRAGGLRPFARRDLAIVDDPECIQMMTDFIAARPELWNEDIGREDDDYGSVA